MPLGVFLLFPCPSVFCRQRLLVSSPNYLMMQTCPKARAPKTAFLCPSPLSWLSPALPCAGGVPAQGKMAPPQSLPKKRSKKGPCPSCRNTKGQGPSLVE